MISLSQALDLKFLLLVLAFGILAACSSAQETTIDWNKRDGAKEAGSAIHNKEPPLFYYRWTRQIISATDAPGIEGCNPSTRASSKVRFIELKDANWNQDDHLTGEEALRLKAAERFAFDYNVATFNARKSELLAVCPKAKLTAFQSFAY